MSKSVDECCIVDMCYMVASGAFRNYASGSVLRLSMTMLLPILTEREREEYVQADSKRWWVRQGQGKENSEKNYWVVKSRDQLDPLTQRWHEWHLDVSLTKLLTYKWVDRADGVIIQGSPVTGDM